MSDEERTESKPAGESSDEGPPSTPFDNPFFLPVVLWAFAAWFGWDIATNAEAYQNYPKFNWGGLVVSTALAAYFTWRAVQERRAEAGRGPRAGSERVKQSTKP